MWKLKTTKRALALTLAAVLLCVPLMGLAAPAADTDTLKPPPCSCETRCTAASINKDCAMCVMDRMCCTGTVPEPPCSCEKKCAEGTKNQDCLRCKDDSSHCMGKEPEPAPVCSCTMKCKEGAVKEDCPVCKTDLTGCKGKAPEPTPAPKPAYTITIVTPTGWHTKTADVQIRVTDDNGTGWKQVEAKIERGGSWIDLTDDFADRNRATVEITENCTVYVTVTDGDGKTHTKSRYIECFDRVAPTIKAGIDGRLLRVEAEDELSGIDAIFIDGERYSGLTNGTLDVRLRDLDGEYKQISIQAVDNAGNKSKTVQLNNPNYEEPKKDKDDKDEDKPSSSCPDATNSDADTDAHNAPGDHHPGPWRHRQALHRRGGRRQLPLRGETQRHGRRVREQGGTARREGAGGTFFRGQRYRDPRSAL